MNDSLSSKLLPLIRAKLTQPGPDTFQKIDPSTGNLGQRTEAELLVDALFHAARNGERFALEMIFFSVDGKPATAEKQIDADTTVEDKLDDVTREHLNRLSGYTKPRLAREYQDQLRSDAESAGDSEVGEAEDSAPDVPASPAREDLGVPTNGAGDPQVAGGQHGVAEAAS